MKQEKKVEYIELIYDLIFVYILGKNNELLHVIENGFIAPGTYLTYILSSLIMLQIWYYTVLFINRYGENDKIMHIGIFINMYLLYFMGRGIRSDWQGEFYFYNIAWALILANLILQYYYQLKKTEKERPWETSQIKMNIRTFLIQIGVIIIAIPIFTLTGVALTPVALLVGIVIAFQGGRVNQMIPVDFGHLTERVMLFVVFTFGEMIIGITDYFNGGLSFSVIYFSLNGFLIVAGLFTSYELLYDRFIDKELTTNGTGYMMIHVFLILALNHITAALEFMREEEIGVLPKNIFLILSFAVYFFMLFLVMRYNKEEYKLSGKQRNIMIIEVAAFIISMLLIYRKSWVSIAITVAFIWIAYITLRVFILNKKTQDNL